MRFPGFSNQFQFRTRSLKSVLSWYFLPISIIPVVAISLYATHVFEQNTRALVIQRAQLEREAVIGEIHNLEAELAKETRSHAAKLSKTIAFRNTTKMTRLLRGFPRDRNYRVYEETGGYLTGFYPRGNEEQIPYLSKNAIRAVGLRQ